MSARYEISVYIPFICESVVLVMNAANKERRTGGNTRPSFTG